MLLLERWFDWGVLFALNSSEEGLICHTKTFVVSSIP